MKHLLKNLAASKGRFRLRADVDAEDGLTGTAKEGTGSLKLMTVFIAVLVLHIVGIGSYTAYHYLKGPSKDAAQSEANAPEAVSPDGTAPDKAVADGTTPAPADAAAPAAPGTETADGASSVPAAPSVQTADGASPAPAAPVAAPGQPVVPGAVKPAAPIAPAPAIVANVPAAPAAAISGGAYVVKSGDTLHKIAATHGMTVAKLKELNGLKSDMLHIGQKLAVGASVAAAAPAPAVASAPAPAAAIAPASAVAAVAIPAVAAAGHSYTVVKGDTLTKIAKSFGTSPAAIMAANKLSDPKKLKIGQALMIPSKAGDRREVSEQQAAPAPLQPQANPDLVMNK